MEPKYVIEGRYYVYEHDQYSFQICDEDGEFLFSMPRESSERVLRCAISTYQLGYSQGAQDKRERIVDNIHRALGLKREIDFVRNLMRQHEEQENRAEQEHRRMRD